MSFPRLMYMVPGKAQVGPHGVLYDIIPVDDEGELALFKGKGWHETLPSAIEAGNASATLKKLQEMEGLPPAPPAKAPKLAKGS